LVPLLQEWLTFVADCKPAAFPDTPLDLLAYLRDMDMSKLNHLQEKLTLSQRLRRHNLFLRDTYSQLSPVAQASFDLQVAGDHRWLDVMPVGDCHLNDRVFLTSFRLRLHIPLPELSCLTSHWCRCRKVKYDQFGDHLLTCKFVRGKERTLLHDTIVQFLSSLDSAARIPSISNPKGPLVAHAPFIEPDGLVVNQRRECDLFSSDGRYAANGLDTLSDVSGVHGITMAMYTQDYHLVNIREGITARTRKKEAKYSDPVSRLGYNFRPLVFETSAGILGDELVAFISQRTSLIADDLGLRQDLVSRHWLGRLSCLLRRQLCFAILNRFDRVMNRSFPSSNRQNNYQVLVQPVIVDVVGGVGD
jgi:hypothetical protein